MIELHIIRYTKKKQIDMNTISICDTYRIKISLSVSIKNMVIDPKEWRRKHEVYDIRHY